MLDFLLLIDFVIYGITDGGIIDSLLYSKFYYSDKHSYL